MSTGSQTGCPTQGESLAFCARKLQSHAIFVGRGGKQEYLVFQDYFHVVDPRRKVAAEGPGHEEALITVEIDLGDVRRRRREVPLVKEACLVLPARELKRLAEGGGAVIGGESFLDVKLIRTCPTDLNLP